MIEITPRLRQPVPTPLHLRIVNEMTGSPRKRYAEGKIDREEFERLKRDLA